MTDDRYLELRARLLQDPVVLRALASALHAPATPPAPAPTNPEDPPLTYAECAELLGCGVPYIRKAVSQGWLEAHGHHVRLSHLQRDVLRYCRVTVRERFLQNLARWKASRQEPRRQAPSPDLFSDAVLQKAHAEALA